MKSSILTATLMSALLLSNVAPATAATPRTAASNRVHVRTKTYGDPMNASYSNVCTGIKYSYYDSQMRLQEVINMKPREDGVFEAIEYQTYIYDSSGLLSGIDGYSYGQISYGDRGRQLSSATTVRYEYDATRTMTASEGMGESVTYEYDADGNLSRKVVTKGKSVSTIEYSGYIAPDKYTYVSCTNSNVANEAEFYDEEITYDENGNKVYAVRTYNTEVGKTYFGKFYGHHAGDFMSAESWQYDEDGNLALYQKAVSQDEVTGEPAWNSRTEYSFVDGDFNRVMHRNYSLTAKGEWAANAQYFVDEYCDFSPVLSFMDTRMVSVERNDEGYNSAAITYEVSAEAAAAGIALRLYRDGEFVQAVDATAGEHTFVDKDILNGQHEYFLITIIDGAEYCVSNKIKADITVDLPKATKLYLSGKTREAGGKTYKLSIGFKAPKGVDDYGFRDYLVVVNAYKSPHGMSDRSNLTDIALTESYDAGRVYEIRVVTRYLCGNSVSEIFYVDTDNTPVGKPADYDDEPIDTGIAGDANGDGEIDVFDVTTVAEYILNGGNDPDASINVDNADVNHDGEINVFDITEISSIILGTSK